MLVQAVKLIDRASSLREVVSRLDDDENFIDDVNDVQSTIDELRVAIGECHAQMRR